MKNKLLEVGFNKIEKVELSKNLKELMASGQIIGNGKFSQACVQKLIRFGYSNSLLTTSGTAALEMMALILDFQSQDEVLLPSYTFTSTANAFALRGSKLKFVDIELDSFNIDPIDLENKITKKSKAFLTIHYGGNCGEFEKLLKIQKQNSLVLLEDAAQCLLAKFSGKLLGTFGDLGSLSFHQTKNVGCGEGGALIINKKKLTERAHLIHEKGTNRAEFLMKKVSKYEWKSLGSSYVLSDLLACVLNDRLDLAQEWTLKRRQTWNHYYRELWPYTHNSKIILQKPFEKSEINGHIFPIIFPNSTSRDKYIKYMRGQGVEVAKHYIPLHLTKIGQSFSASGKTNLPNTMKVYKGLVRLPMGPFGNRVQDKIIDKTIKFLKDM